MKVPSGKDTIEVTIAPRGRPVERGFLLDHVSAAEIDTILDALYPCGPAVGGLSTLTYLVSASDEKFIGEIVRAFDRKPVTDAGLRNSSSLASPLQFYRAVSLYWAGNQGANESSVQAVAKFEEFLASGYQDVALTSYARMLSAYLSLIALGNDEAAVAEYRQLLTQKDVPRHLALTAHWYLGLALEKLGRRGEARLTFRTMRDDYRDLKFARTYQLALERLKESASPRDKR